MYLMRCIERNMKLLEDYDEKGFIYERGSILLKGFFFKKQIKLKETFTLKTINLMSYAANIVIWYAQLA